MIIVQMERRFRGQRRKENGQCSLPAPGGSNTTSGNTHDQPLNLWWAEKDLKLLWTLMQSGENSIRPHKLSLLPAKKIYIKFRPNPATGVFPPAFWDAFLLSEVAKNGSCKMDRWLESLEKWQHSGLTKLPRRIGLYTLPHCKEFKK